jgi:uncharacterized FAD-dependent dehydrogenase
VLNLPQGIGEPDAALAGRACEAAGLASDELLGFGIARRSVDARRHGSHSLRFVVHADITVQAGLESRAFERACRAGRVVEGPERRDLEVDSLHPSLVSGRVAVVGAGPGGLFAALTLARNGVEVDLIDRGQSLKQRGRSLNAFERERKPDPESNLLFGEGGAGTYSDGKLYTRVDHPLSAPLIEELVACGAPADIGFDARAHIGTDKLHRLLPVLRERLEAQGVRFHFGTRMDGLVLGESASGRSVRALKTQHGELPCRAVVLAPGHSARDTWLQLQSDGVVVEPKPFQFGIRVEHPQPMISAGRYGVGAEADALGPASYGLVCKASGGLPSVHSFCMCPGGRIVASVNEPGFLCTNGMSNSRHSSPYANAALVTTLGPRETGPGVFAGVDFQRRLEARCFEAGGADYSAPAQRAPDFIAGRESNAAGPSSYRLGTVPGRLDLLLPEGVRDAIRRALERFSRPIPGFSGDEALLVGIESRSSGPIRLPRDDQSRRAQGFANLFPVGEGAGYAGGIMSAAIDGARSAQALLVHGVD